QLRSDPRDPLVTTIQAAAKVTGRLDGGAQFGLVAVSSAREQGVAGQTIEPHATTLVGRFVQDFRTGRSQLGTMVTGLVRDLDPTTEPLLRRDAYTLLFQGFHRFADSWEFSGYTGRSAARGSAAAIARTQLTSVHYAQRPDGDYRYDPARTSMTGGVSSLSLRRYAGRVRWETTTRYAEPGTELNDLGFVVLVNDMMLRNQFVYSTLVPKGWYRQANAVLSSENHWTTGGLPTGFTVLVHSSASLANFWTTSLTWTASQLGETHCVSCARGGPALRVSPNHRLGITLDLDARRVLKPEFELQLSRGAEGRASSRLFSAGIVGRVGTRTSVELGGSLERRTDDAQWVANAGALLSDTVHYTFARLDQHILAVTARANVTLTPTLSVQLYAQPFIATGAWSDWRELADAGAASYDDRYQPYGGGAVPAGFNSKQFNSNTVLRWEYRPGSTVFLVWQQGRRDARDPGTFDAGRDVAHLFNARPDNTLLLKVSYWFNP
ncbi:MAG: DUF5916 domain-containing protein, partial [Gemmatimonadota bacterium]|nr:DUF5916 domain-containing protein [Gemmatimonadota bacterium]